MSASQHQRNWQRIHHELTAAIEELPGPVAGKVWEEFGGSDAKKAFRLAVENALAAELKKRSGKDEYVNKAIEDSLTTLGERLADFEGAQQHGDG